MAEIRIEIKKDELGQVKELSDEAVARALEQCGALWESYAKQMAPVDTGRLRNSIEHHPEGNDTMVVETDVEYAVWVETGHTQQPGRFVPAIGKRLVNDYVPPQPFMKPSGESNIGTFKTIIENELKK